MTSQRDTHRYQALLRACRDAAREAAAFIATQSGARHTLAWEEKSRTDFVSEVDRGAERLVRETLERQCPGALIIGEELTPLTAIGNGTTFIVDPLDGTTNFLHGYPQYAVSIAALVDGIVCAGVVHDVTRDTSWCATLRGGARVDDTPVRVSAIREPARALIGTGYPFKDAGQLPQYLPQLARISSATAGVRRAGSAALDLVDVACGRFDAFWELRLAPWDMAAGMLLIREAGGRVTDLAGVDVAPVHGPVVASNGLLHDWMLQQLVPA